MQISQASIYRKFWSSLFSFLSVSHSSLILCFSCDSEFFVCFILDLSSILFTVENRNHLFFLYPFSGRIRKRAEYWCYQESIGDDWDDIVEWAENQWKGKSLKSVCSKLGLSVAVYHIWSHRNAIIFQGLIKTEDQIVGLIKKQFKNRVEWGSMFPSTDIN